jgi:hypothetical protein
MVRCGASGPLDGADAAPSSSPPLSWLSSTRFASAVAESWKGEILARVRGDIVRLERPCLDPTPTPSTRGPPPPGPRVGPTSCAPWSGCLGGAASAGLPTIVGKCWIWSQMPTSMRGRKGMGYATDQALRSRRDSRGLLARSWSQARPISRSQRQHHRATMECNYAAHPVFMPRSLCTLYFAKASLQPRLPSHSRSPKRWAERTLRLEGGFHHGFPLHKNKKKCKLTFQSIRRARSVGVEWEWEWGSGEEACGADSRRRRDHLTAAWPMPLSLLLRVCARCASRC